MVRVFRQISQQLKFLGGKLFLLPVDPYPPGCLIDLESPDLNQIVLGGRAAHQPVVSGQMRLDSGHQLTGREGLCDIVVRSKSQAADLVDILLLGRNHQNRGVLHFPDPLADLKAVHSRKHQIQNKHVVISRQGLFTARVAVRLNLHRKTAQFQIVLLQLSDRQFIFDNQHFTHRVPPDIF